MNSIEQQAAAATGFNGLNGTGPSPTFDGFNVAQNEQAVEVVPETAGRVDGIALLKAQTQFVKAQTRFVHDHDVVALADAQTSYLLALTSALKAYDPAKVAGQQEQFIVSLTTILEVVGVL